MFAGDVAVFLPPFRVKTSLEIPQGEAVGRFSQEGTLRLDAERDAVDVVFRDEIVGHLTDPVAKQVLPLLQSPGLVEFSIGCWREVGGTAEKVEVVITPLLSNSEMDQRQATTVRRLRAISRRTEFQLNSECGRRVARQKIAAAKLPVDVLGNVRVFSTVAVRCFHFVSSPASPPPFWTLPHSRTVSSYTRSRNMPKEEKLLTVCNNL